jgi:hypothetical protein
MRIFSDSGNEYIFQRSQDGSYTLFPKERYSTNEMLTDKAWINGKPIYRKVIDLGILPDNTTNFINHNIDHLDTVVNMTGMAIGETVSLMLPHVDPTDNAGAINLYVNSTQVGIQTADTRHYYTGYAILEYTKTTN